MASNEAEVLKAEAVAEENDTIEVEFRGNKYTLPALAKEWDVEVMEALEDGRQVGVLRALLGDDQWRLLKSRHNLKLKDLDEISDAFLAKVGLSSGKSES